MAVIVQPWCDNITDFLLDFHESGYTEAKDTALSFCYMIVGIAAIAGNICALYFFIKVDTRLTTSKIFYSAFAVTDLLTGFCACWTGFVFAKPRPFYLCSNLYMSTAANNTLGVLETFVMFASTNIVALMSVSRCVSVVTPFRYKSIFRPFSCYLLICIVCLHPFVIGILPFFFKDPTKYYHFQVISGQFAYLFSDLVGQERRHLANVLLSLLPRFFAILVMLGCSVAVAVLLLQGTNIRSNKAPAQRNASVTLLLLAGVYFITYIPFCFLILVDATSNNSIFSVEQFLYFVPSVYLVAYVSSAANPFIYHLRGRSMFGDQGARKSTMHSNPAVTKLSVVHAEDKL